MIHRFLKTSLTALFIFIFCHVAEADTSKFNQTLKKIEDNILQAQSLYIAKKYDQAADLISDSYFDIFESEGLETAIGMRSSSVKTSLEAKFNDLRVSLSNNAGLSQVNENASQLVTKLRAATFQLSDDESWWDKFLSSLLIILREGFEAILVVGAITAFLVKTKHKHLLKIVRNASLAAIGFSFVLAALFQWVFRVTSAQKELIEGLTMILACGVLFTVGHWLISQAESQHWMKYVKNQLNGAISTKSQKALWMTCFLAVFREGAETVLFYQALWASSAPQMHSSIIGGLLAGIVCLAFVFVAFNKGALKIPMKPFFRVTSSLLYFLSFTIAGKAVIELQAGGYLPVSLLKGWPPLPIIGFYPTIENLILQGMIIIALVASITWVSIRKNRKVLKAADKAVQSASVLPIRARVQDQFAGVAAAYAKETNPQVSEIRV